MDKIDETLQAHSSGRYNQGLSRATPITSDVFNPRAESSLESLFNNHLNCYGNSLLMMFKLRASITNRKHGDKPMINFYYNLQKHIDQFRKEKMNLNPCKITAFWAQDVGVIGANEFFVALMFNLDAIHYGDASKTRNCLRTLIVKSWARANYFGRKVLIL